MWSKVIRFFKQDSPSREDLEVWKGEMLTPFCNWRKRSYISTLP